MDRATLQRYSRDRHSFRQEQIVLPNGKRLGDVEEPWQTKHVFGPLDASDRSGEPKYRLLYYELARGHAKTATLAAEALITAFLDGDVRVYLAAADADQARIAFQMLTGFIKRNPALRPSFKVLKDEIEVPATGASIKVLSSDAPSTYGLGGLSQKLLILADELWAWRGRDLWDALFTATAKTRHWRVLIASNAGFDTTSVAWEIRELCIKKSDPRFYLYSPDGVVASWIKRRDLETQRRSLPAEVFQRLWENRWTEGSGSFTTREQLTLCIDPDRRPEETGRHGLRYFVGVDLGLRRDRTARAIVHLQQDEDRNQTLVILDALRVWQGNSKREVNIEEVEEDLLDVAKRFNRPRFLFDPWQLASSRQRLQGRLDIEPFRFGAEEVRRLSENLLSLVRNGRLRLFADEELERELLRLQTLQTSYGWRLDHRSGGYSDRAMAVGLASLLAVEEGVAHPATNPESLKTLLDLNRSGLRPPVQGFGFLDGANERRPW